MIVELLEKVRINISEEESRLVLGDRYRDTYLYAIRDFDLCYKHTGDVITSYSIHYTKLYEFPGI